MSRLSPSAHEILRVLASRGPATPTDLSDALEHPPLTIRRALSLLESLGLVDHVQLPQARAGRSPHAWFLKEQDDPQRPAPTPGKTEAA